MGDGISDSVHVLADPQPRPVLALEYSTAKAPPYTKANRASMLTAWIIGLVGWIALWIETKSVLIFGPALLLSGTVLLIFAMLAKSTLRIVLAGSHLGICLLLFSLALILHWSPQEAQWPFIILASIYIVAASILSVISLKRHGTNA